MSKSEEQPWSAGNAVTIGASQSPESVSSDLSRPPSDLLIVDDEGLAHAFSQLAQGQSDLLVVANNYTVCVFQQVAPQGAWQAVCCGEFGPRAVEAAKPLTKGRLLWSNTADTPWCEDPNSTVKVKATMQLLRRWLQSSEADTGREGDITPAIKDELTYLAGWRCQFTGCGRDLRKHTATGTKGRFSYFAHIVAASENGPRGHPLHSKLLASDLGNFMLLCDECHRRIDKIDPATYTVQVLREMRETSIDAVKRLLDTMQHKEVNVIAILGNVAGQPAQLSIDDAYEALWGSGLRTNEARPARYFYPGGQNHDVHAATYWGSLFQQMKSDLPQLQTLLNGTRSGVARPRLAIFPLHSTSVLLLAGRVLGDASGTHVFQPHRNKVGAGTRWAWPSVNSAASPSLDKFKHEVVVPHAGGDEAALVVALTSDIDAARMPSTCAVQGNLRLPTLRIVGPTFDKDCIQHPKDLQILGIAADAVMQILQDQWRVRKVHLFVSAPASAVVVLGQKMQARHHADYICYEAVAGPGSAYKVTIEITSTSVRELVTGKAESLSLQP